MGTASYPGSPEPTRKRQIEEWVTAHVNHVRAIQQAAAREDETRAQQVCLWADPKHKPSFDSIKAGNLVMYQQPGLHLFPHPIGRARIWWLTSEARACSA